MKNLFLALSLLSPLGLSAQVLLTDDFNDDSINSTLWTASAPFGDSSTTESSGYLQVQNRGRLISNQDFTAPYSITGSIQLLNSEFSNAKIVVRTSDSDIGFGEMGGVAIQIGIREDSGSYQNQIYILTNGAPMEFSAITGITTAVSLNTWYAFEIRDTGSQVSLYWNGSSTPTLSLNTSYFAGSRIGFYNREGFLGGSGISNGGIARLDSLTVTATAIPEPASYSALIGLFVLGLVAARRKKIA